MGNRCWGLMGSQAGGWDRTSCPAQPGPFRFISHRLCTLPGGQPGLTLPGSCKGRDLLHGCRGLTAVRSMLPECSAPLSVFGTLRPSWCLHNPGRDTQANKWKQISVLCLHPRAAQTGEGKGKISSVWDIENPHILMSQGSERLTFTEIVTS